MKVIFCIYSQFRLNLYLKLASIYRDANYEVLIITQDYKSYKISKKNGFNTFKLNIDKINSIHNPIDLSTTIDVSMNLYTDKIANSLYYSFYNLISSLKLNSKDLIFAGNGYHVQDYVLKNIQNKFDFDIIYSELSNFPGLTFFDTKGSNIRSNLYEISKEYTYDELDFKPDFTLLDKFKNKTKVPQSEKNYLSVIFNYCIDSIMSFPSHNVLRFKSLKFFDLLSFTYSRLRYKKKKHTVFSESLPEKYLFYPFQVFNDSQLLLNSEFDNFYAIEYFNDYCKNNDLTLVVKMHPAELDYTNLNKAINYCNKNSIIISDNNTPSLISGATIVGVINSTVGLESIIYGKKTIFLSPSFYTKLQNNEFREFYFNEYLINIDFFNGKSESPDKEILSKLEDLLSFKLI